jgi:ABC-type Fe3+/spermidine/putrescine transport system ATPase subunit
MTDTITIQDLRKRFSGNTAATLHGLSLDIAAGSFFTLFGPSGCGKSTLLRCLAGLETPDAGDIAIGSTVVFSSRSGAYVPPNRRRIGMVFQSYAIWPHMTVLENVAFPLEVRRERNAKERARSALEIVGLAALEQRYASKLSGGQQQRVALARAIVADPAVLLLDEPLSNLDAALRDQMRAELQSLHKRLGMTAVYVTHDQTEALSMSDRIAVMREGEFVEIGTPSDLYHNPRSAFTARLIGSANILDGVASAAGNGLTRVDTAFGALLSVDQATGPVQAFVRPDKIVPLDGSADRCAAINVIGCRVRDRRFAGEGTELDLIGTGSDTPQRVLRCRVHTPVAASVERDIQVTINPSDVRIFPAENI